MNLDRVSGRIEALRRVEGKRSIVFSPQMREAAGVSAIVFAAAGMGSAAVQTSMNAGDAADDVTLYSFEIDGSKFAGCTRKATFSSGDEVEIVFQRKHEGNEVLAVRRPSTRSIWLYPYMSRGSGAAVRHGAEIWWRSSLAGTVFVSAICALAFAIEGFDLNGFLFATSVVALTSFLALGLVGVLISPKYLRFARAADQVFESFGYANPKDVDLGKTSKMHRKAHGIPWTLENNTELWY